MTERKLESIKQEEEKLQKRSIFLLKPKEGKNAPLYKKRSVDIIAKKLPQLPLPIMSPPSQTMDQIQNLLPLTSTSRLKEQKHKKNRIIVKIKTNNPEEAILQQQSWIKISLLKDQATQITDRLCIIYTECIFRTLK